MSKLGSCRMPLIVSVDQSIYVGSIYEDGLRGHLLGVLRMSACVTVMICGKVGRPVDRDLRQEVENVAVRVLAVLLVRAVSLLDAFNSVQHLLLSLWRQAKHLLMYRFDRGHEAIIAREMRTSARLKTSVLPICYSIPFP